MRVARCRSCDAPIVWLKTNRGKSLPMDADFMAQHYDLETDEASEFDFREHSDGVHFKSCPHADEHRRPR